MNLKKLANLIFVWLLLSCSFNQDNNRQKYTLSVDNNDSILPLVTQMEIKKFSVDSDEIMLTKSTDSSYCFIKDVIVKKNKTYIKVDFIQFYRDERAVAEAKKRGAAEYDIDEKGDTTYFVYNDYFIVNNNPKLRTFILTDDSKIEFIEWLDAPIPNPKMITNKTLKRLKLSPYLIKTENGQIKELKEIFIP